MSSILTNYRVAATMGDLEIRARQGDPWAQAELTKKCWGFAGSLADESKAGADGQVRKEQLKLNK